MYATDHADFIVNGQADLDYQVHNPGKPWLMDGYSYASTDYASQSEAKMRTGALAPYVGDVRAYVCPSRYRQEGVWRRGIWLSSYHTSASMNRWPQDQWLQVDRAFRARHDLGRTVLFVRKTSELVDPGPASRMAFMDLGAYGGEDSWGQPLGGGPDQTDLPDIQSLAWSRGWAWPAVHHANGTCVSFGDGHVEYWRWMDPTTAAFGRLWVQYIVFGDLNVPKSPSLLELFGNPDSLRLTRAVWGKGP
jgi:hypothetical protein